MLDFRKASRQIVHDALIREAEHLHTGCSEVYISFGVVSGLGRMDSSVNFNDEAGCVTIEVYDVHFEHLLATEMQPISWSVRSARHNTASAGVISWRNCLARS